MKKLLFVVVAFFCLQTISAQQNILAKNPIVITGKLVKITKPLRDFKPSDKAIPDVIVRDLNGIVGKDEDFEEEGPKHPFGAPILQDEALQTNYPNKLKLNSTTTDNAITSNFNGIGYQPLNPPDPSLCVGPNHVIQMVNGSSGGLFKVFSKTGGQIVAQTFLDAITGKGGLGDPICLYDQLADRYVLTEFNNKAETTTEGLTFAVSQTNDPAGAWYVYFFGTGTIFPDYPKFSVWTDAYYGTTNDFANGSAYAGSTVYAFDRAKMLAGNSTATVQKFTLGNTDKYFTMSPVCLEGNALPPTGTGGLFAYMNDNVWSGSATDSIGLFEFKVNFSNPSLTTVTTKSSLAVTAYKSDICTATRGQCISQAGSATKLEGLEQRIMNQPIYRKFAGYEGIVLTHLVDKGANIAGVRWYELRKTASNWSVYQQSTYGPDNTNRWLPAICYDAAGNIGLAYNVSSAATGFNPGARYTGRKECDPLNTMSYAESVIVAGTAANGSTRYGDYNQLVADPDGVRFWFTCEYNSASTWNTRIASFSLDNCTAATCGDPTGLSASSITNNSAVVSWSSVPNASSYTIDYKLNTSATWINASTNTTAISLTISGLSQGSIYDYRVIANCAAGSGNYVSAQFTTTTPATCNAPTGLTATNVTATTSSISWAAVAGAANYAVDYKLNSSATWISAATATTATSISLSALTAGSLYDYRVRANCTAVSLNSAYTSAQFTTLAASTCPGSYDVATNGTSAGAAVIPFNTDIKGLINPANDIDYYKFVITTAGTATITLSTLPADYDVRLYSSNGTTQLAISQNGGTTAETITRTYTAGTYYVRVYGYNGANNATSCYTLKVQLGSATAPEIVTNIKGVIKLYPNPVSNILNVSVLGEVSTAASLQIIDANGRTVMVKNIINNPQAIDISKLGKGVYMIKLKNGKNNLYSKFVKE
jgi:Secretion system C-terminal sorting domain/Fibronectin type III domain/Bacterial pre-peptidase C-terminal domain